MKIGVDVDGKTYIPIVAVPYVTGGFFTVRDVIIMASVPGLFAHACGGTALDAFEFLPYGLLTYVAERKLSAIADICVGERRDPSLHKVAGMVVPAEGIRDLMHRIADAGSAPWIQQQPRPPASWDMEAPLPPSVVLAIIKNLPIDIDLTIHRSNSADLTRGRIQDAVERISRDAAQHKISFDRTQLPGHKSDFARILKRIDRRIVRAPGTLDTHFSKLGLRWRQGSKREDAAALLALYGLNLD